VQFEHCERMKIEGIVSKRIDRAYVSGPSRSWAIGMKQQGLVL
jgi:ATP-dependent DNA ligase